MKRDWTADELIEHWTLLPGEKQWLANKTGPTRLDFAVLLKFFQHEGRFPQQPQEIPDIVVAFLARQVGVDPSEWPRYRWQKGGPSSTNAPRSGSALASAKPRWKTPRR